MILEINHHSGIPFYRQVIDQIREQIMTGQMAEGEQLEGVRSLAARLKINPMTVSKAYSLLEREGLLARQRGIGLFVARIHKGTKKAMKAKILEQELKEAAVLAVQMNVPEKEASRLFEEYYRQFTAKKKGGPDD